MHTIARGIGKLIYDMTTVEKTKNDRFYFTDSDNLLCKDGYPFYIHKDDLENIGASIENSRSHIPVSFQGSFDNIIAKIEGTRAFDWLDYLLYIVPTIVVPYLRGSAVKKAVLALVKGCSLALQWTLTSELIDEMDK